MVKFRWFTAAFCPKTRSKSCVAMAVDVLVYVEDMGCCTTWLVKGDPFFSGVISIFLSILYAFNTQRERSETPQASRNPEQLHIISLMAFSIIKTHAATIFQKSQNFHLLS